MFKVRYGLFLGLFLIFNIFFLNAEVTLNNMDIKQDLLRKMLLNIDLGLDLDIYNNIVIKQDLLKNMKTSKEMIDYLSVDLESTKENIVDIFLNDEILTVVSEMEPEKLKKLSPESLETLKKKALCLSYCILIFSEEANGIADLFPFTGKNLGSLDSYLAYTAFLCMQE